MAIDTVRLQSVYITEELANSIERVSMQRLGIDLKTDTMMYCITTSELLGSYDNRISVQIKRDKYESSKNTIHGKVHTSKVVCDPYIIIEASLHKMFLGHNIKGGTSNFIDSCNYLIYVVEKMLNIDLPIADDWLVLRIDYAYVFNLKCIEAVQEFFFLMKNSSYPRRGTPTFHQLHGLSLPASTTMVKAYNKGVEFTKHDFKKLKFNGIFTEKQLFEMVTEANGILRFEIGIKSKKLKYDFDKGVEHDDGTIIYRYGHEPQVKHISEKYLKKTYETEVFRLMKEGREESKKTKTGLEVKRILDFEYGSRLANVLFSAWLSISQYGIDFYKENTSKSRYHENLKKLREVGISINLTDQKDFTEITGERKSMIPDDFQPIEKDPRRISYEAEEIKELIAKMKDEKRFKRTERYSDHLREVL